MSSNHSPEKMKIENAWVIENLNLPSVKVSKEDIQNKWEHLKESSIEMLNLNVSLIVGADMSHQHISLDLSSEDKNDQIGVSSKLSWVIMKGKSIVHRTVSSNSIISSRTTLKYSTIVLGSRLLWHSC